MKKYTFLIITLLISSLSIAQTYDWINGHIGSSDDAYQKIITDANGNVYATGFIEGGIDIGDSSFTASGSGDLVISKYAQDGSLTWSKQYGGSPKEGGFDITLDPNDNVIVCGFFFGGNGVFDFGSETITNAGVVNGFITKIASNGDYLWSKRVGGTNQDIVWGVTTDQSGNIYATGAIASSTAYFGPIQVTGNDANGNVFVTKLDADGNFVWAKNFGSFGSDSGVRIETDGNGDLIVCGVFSSTVDFEAKTLTSRGGHDIFILKMKANDGSVTWAKSIGGKTSSAGTKDYAKGLTITPENSILIGGYFNDSCYVENDTIAGASSDNILVAKFNSDGTFDWGKSFDGSQSNRVFDISTNNINGNIAISGDFKGSINTSSYYDLIANGFNYDGFLLVLDNNGDLIHQHSFGSSGIDQANSIKFDSYGNLIVSGTYSPNATFGDTTLAGATAGDIFIFKLSDYKNNVGLNDLEHSREEAFCWPNPFINELEFSNNIISIDIYNIEGNLILRKSKNELSFNKLNLDNLKSGTYLIKGYTNDNKVVTNMILKN